MLYRESCANTEFRGRDLRCSKGSTGIGQGRLGLAYRLADVKSVLGALALWAIEGVPGYHLEPAESDVTEFRCRVPAA